MLTTLLAWIYITFLCWTWGILFLLFTKKITKDDLVLPHFSIVCITGLSMITIVAGIASIFIPLGEWWVQLFFIAPCAILLYKKDSPSFFTSFRKEFFELNVIPAILLSACLLMTLVMSTWTIVHPDTLGYHAQTIQWIEKYKTVPGLVHLHVRFGYQGLWFVDCALFGFSFAGKGGITFLNSTLLLWFFIFIINRINFNFFKEGKKIPGLLWLVFLMLSMWSYTQVRLTATSASPDFIAAIFVLTIIYLLLEKNHYPPNASNWLLVTFLSLVAVTIKLSVAPILLISVAAAFVFLKQNRFIPFLTLIALSILIFSPFFIRNIITSGYVIFPSTTLDVTKVDWKYPKEFAANEKNYITAYAKKPGVRSIEEINSVVKMSPAQWIPGWWQSRSIADKSIVILLILSFLAGLLFIKEIIRAGSVSILILATMLSGIIFWFVNAPDPRFGFGFIIGFMGSVACLFLKEKEILIRKYMSQATLLIFSTIILAYTGYRFINFFSKDQLVVPLGIAKSEYKSFECHDLKINSPLAGEYPGAIPVPCADNYCERFS
ncbi:MAG TPA: hypothetical protein VJ765_16300, partial [Chitinophagaceae bacterium]|nr:hypothetical protein [Chitinophagaceae bacterium]